MNELDRWADRSSLMPSREDRASKKAIAHLVAETKFAGCKVDAEAALTGRIMERACDIDAHRRSLSGGDPTLDSILARIEMGFVEKAIRIQRSFGSEFPL